MKKLKVSFCLAVVLCFLLTNTTFANQWNWASVFSGQRESVLLKNGETRSSDTVHRYGRGDYLAEGSVEIANLEDGRLEVRVMTLAHVNVDKILHTVFIDVWDADREDWEYLDYWDFEITKEEVEDEELYMFSTNFTLSGYEVGRYYRLRGLHGVELNDELEACATETNGVKLTDWRN